MKKESLKEKNNLFVYIMLFFTLAFIGWCFEVLNEIRKGHGFINRGVLHGPWLPIYGFGGLIIYILLKKYYKKPIIVFSLSFLISAVIEYFTSFYLEITKGMVWWDYSKKPFNINGRICLLYTLIFALLATILYYFVIPKIINLLKRVNYKVLSVISIILLSLYLVDNIYSYKKPNIVAETPPAISIGPSEFFFFENNIPIKNIIKPCPTSPNINPNIINAVIATNTVGSNSS